MEKKIQQNQNGSTTGDSICKDFFDASMLKDMYAELIGVAVFGLIIGLLQFSLQKELENAARPTCHFEGIVLDSINNEKKPIEAIHITVYDAKSNSDKPIGSDITSIDGMFKIPIPNGTKFIKVVFQDVYETRYNSYTIPHKEVINWKIAQKQYLQKNDKKNK